MSSFTAYNVIKLMDTIGEEGVQEILSDFSCEKNLEIEIFVREKALDFAKKRMSVTYLVVDEDSELAAIFTLTHKAIQIGNEGLSRTVQKKMQRFAQLDEANDTYFISAFLIAQFGKNLAYTGTPITGNQLMVMVSEILSDVQAEIGGGVVYLECEEKEALLSFYQNESNRFRIFDERYSLVDNTKYIQLFKFI